MKTPLLAVALFAACGSPDTFEDLGAYPLSVDYDGTLGKEATLGTVTVDAARSYVGRVQVTNAAGNGRWNRTQLRAAVWTRDGRNIGAFTVFDVPAVESPGVSVVEAVALRDLEIFPEAATLVLFATPLYAEGPHRVRIEGFDVVPAVP